MSDNRQHHLKALFDATQYLIQVTSPFMLPVSAVSVFTACALWQQKDGEHGEPMSLEELAVRLGKTSSAMSGLLNYCSDEYRKDKDGLGLIRTVENPFNARKKTFELTLKGEAVAAHLKYLYHRESGQRG